MIVCIGLSFLGCGHFFTYSISDSFDPKNKPPGTGTGLPVPIFGRGPWKPEAPLSCRSEGGKCKSYVPLTLPRCSFDAHFRDKGDNKRDLALKFDLEPNMHMYTHECWL